MGKKEKKKEKERLKCQWKTYKNNPNITLSSMPTYATGYFKISPCVKKQTLP